MQFSDIIFKMKIFQFLRFHITIRHPYPDPTQSILYSIDSCITFCLCKMHRHGFPDLMYLPVGSLDFIDRNSHKIRISRLYFHRRQLRYCTDLTCFFYYNAISSAFHNYAVFFHVSCIAQSNLRMIGRTHPPLYHTVDPSTLLHGIISGTPFSIVNISAPQNKFHQISDGNMHLCHSLCSCFCLLHS